jgi:hypothetical protein
MADACYSTLRVDAGGKNANRITGTYLGFIITISCAASFTPIELFLVEIWSRHGFFSLLLFVVPFITGWMIAELLPARYYRIKTFESSGLVYERLGIRFFKRFVPKGDYINRIIRRSEPAYRVVRNEASIDKFEAETRLAEKCHIAWLFLTLPSTVYALLLGWNGFALWLLLPNIPLHVYPILLQRYTRTRIQKVLNRRKYKR